MLGGLVIKAGMDSYPSAVILGALLDAFNQINGSDGDDVIERFRALGDGDFSRLQQDGGNRFL